MNNRAVDQTEGQGLDQEEEPVFFDVDSMLNDEG